MGFHSSWVIEVLDLPDIVMIFFLFTDLVLLFLSNNHTFGFLAVYCEARFLLSSPTISSVSVVSLVRLR